MEEEPKVNVGKWTIEEVVQWATDVVGEKHAEKLREQEIGGAALLRMTYQKFREYGIPGGPSTDLESAVEKLKSKSTEIGYINDSTSVFPLIETIGKELQLDVSHCVQNMCERWVDSVGDVRIALPESWTEWEIPPLVEKKLREIIGFGYGGKRATLRERFILTLQNSLGEQSGISLENLLRKALDSGRLIIDEMQYLYQYCPEMLISIIQYVDSICAKHSLILCGTPRIGVYPVLFEEHTLGRLSHYLVSNFNALEMYAVLKKVCGIDFSVYLKLWSCFGGIPGLYHMAYNSNYFTKNSVDMNAIHQMLRRQIVLTAQEKVWVERASKQEGYPTPETERDAVFNRLLTMGVLVLEKSVTYLKDKVLRALKTLDSTSVPLEERTSNICGFGLETMAESIADDLCSLLSIPDSNQFRTSSIGYGVSDVDVVMLRKEGGSSEAVCFCCKLNGAKHEVDFFDNIEKHLSVARPKKIYLVLCSTIVKDCNPWSEMLKFPPEYKFSWGYVEVETKWLDIGSAVVDLESRKGFEFHSDSTWPMLVRISEQVPLVDEKSKILHIIGHRRVGKTHLIKNMLTEKDIYIDTKILNL
eukprot:TRINITY_DN237_c0_g2_i1.p1 TRINITY_DN237_c0_g2~~TRINITY_DN237_c0_g2_i1.p1  ORF type:complete len:587 (+),score=57.90 TRINITY_DN237_c0_g2_i1:135-1895(+)